MSRRFWLPWMGHALLGLAGLGLGLALATLSVGASIGPGPVIAVLFGLAALTGLAKSGTA